MNKWLLTPDRAWLMHQSEITTEQTMLELLRRIWVGGYLEQLK